MEILNNISPLDHRYRLSQPELYKKMAAILSEEASIKYQLQAEIALIQTHLEQRQELTPENLVLLEKAAARLSCEEVYEEESKTHHNIRALVNVLTRHLPKHLATLAHLGATSMDIVDTVAALRLKEFVNIVILPEMVALEKQLIKLCRQEASTPQIGRTHGQYAVTITLGHMLAEYVSRLGQSIVRLPQLSEQLRGKLSGAVGGYNATSLISNDPQEFEKNYLGRLGLQAAEYSSQIVMPEYQLRLLQELNLAFGIIANLADDLRHLQRSEIDEVREFFAAEQVGSSTMPQKRNPWNCEHIKSLWKAFAPRILSFYLDQISEHQRDLSNSASMRFIADYLAGFSLAVSRTRQVMEKLSFNKKRLEHNLEQTGGSMMAEPLYILLAMSRLEDAHETVRQLTLESEKLALPLAVLLRQNYPELQQRLASQLAKVGYPEDFLDKPTFYTGICAKRAESLSLRYAEEMEKIERNFKE